MNGSPLEANEVVLEAKDDQKIDAQTWIRCTTDAQGWFALKNPTSGRFLTATSFSRLTITGKLISIVNDFTSYFSGKINN